MSIIVVICLVLALAAFLFAAFAPLGALEAGRRVSIVALGLALWVFTAILSALGTVVGRHP